MANVQQIRTSELRYRRLFEAAQDGILILDAETGVITDVNPFLVRMLGYSITELVGKKLWQVGTFKDMEASQEAFAALQKNEYIRYDDLPLRAKSGKLIDVEFVSNVYLVGKEKVIQCNILAANLLEQKSAQCTQDFISCCMSPSVRSGRAAPSWSLCLRPCHADARAIDATAIACL